MDAIDAGDAMDATNATDAIDAIECGKIPVMTTAAARKDRLRRSLERILAVLINEYKPEKIILFGSLASGEVHEGSDLDLVIIKDTSQRPIDRQVEVYRLTKPDIGIDLFIYTPQEFKYLDSIGFSVVKEIVAKGKILYEARGQRVAKDR